MASSIEEPDTKQVQEEIHEDKSTSDDSRQDSHTIKSSTSTPVSKNSSHQGDHSYQLTQGIPVPEKLQSLFQDSTTMFYIDTGGQPEFQEVLPCLVVGPMLFVLMFDLSVDFETSKYIIPYNGSKKCKPYKSTVTVKQVLMQYLSSIWSYCNGLEDPSLVKIVILATHKDKVSDSCKQQKIVNVNKSLNEANEVQIVKNAKLLKLHKGLVMIPIDNNDPNDVDEVKEIIKTLITENRKYKQALPVNWLCFELALRKRELSMVPISECQSLAKRYHIGEKEFFEALGHLHRKMGVIRYYDGNEKLKSTVITKPAALFKAITKLIVATFNDDDLRYGYFKKDDVEKLFGGQKKMDLNCHIF